MHDRVHRPRLRGAAPILIKHFVRAECSSCSWKGTLAGTEGFARSEGEKHSCLDLATDLGPETLRGGPAPY